MTLDQFIEGKLMTRGRIYMMVMKMNPETEEAFLKAIAEKRTERQGSKTK